MDLNRQTAYKILIKDIIDSSFVKGDQNNPSHIIDKYGRDISRVNILATVISKFEDNIKTLMIDDNSSRISVRIFNDSPAINFNDINIGDLVLVIGRIREFNNELYIVPEIIRKEADIRWAEVRKKEIEIIKRNLKVKEDKKEEEINQDYVVEDVVEKSPIDKILDIIKELDKGDGADIDEVIRVSNLDNAEKIIENLLLDGQIFEAKKGRLKILV